MLLAKEEGVALDTLVIDKNYDDEKVLNVTEKYLFFLLYFCFIYFVFYPKGM